MKNRRQQNYPHPIWIIQIVFIGLKLFGSISWAWLEVMSPVIAFFALGVLSLVVVDLFNLKK